MKHDVDWRRSDLRKDKQSRQRQGHTQIAKSSGMAQLKCRVTDQFLPGEPSPFDDDQNLDINTWRVCLIPVDLHGEGWSPAMNNKSFVVQHDPDVLMMMYGSHGLLDSVVCLKFSFPNLRSTGEVCVESQTSFGENDRIDASDVHIAQAFDLGEIVNFSFG